MAKFVLTALAATAILATGLSSGGVRAMTAAPALGAPAALIRQAAIVCGGNGCNAVQVKGQQKRKFQPLGYTKPLPKSS